MKKYLIITDIHGSYKYLEMALVKFEQYKCDKILILGDILYHGPRNDLPEGYEPKKVFAKLNELKDKILAIHGNCDAEIDEMVLDFPLFPEAIITLGNKEFLLTHGDHLDEVEYAGNILCGHHHKSVIEDDIYYLGSTSIPKDGHHAYMIAKDFALSCFDLMDDTLLYQVDLK